MKTIKVKVFEYSELEDKAKEKAKQWYRETLDYEWYDFTKEDFERILKDMGFKNVSSQFSGFYSQGDGASFNFKGLDIKALLNFSDKHNSMPYFDILDGWKQAHKKTLRNIKRFQDILYCNSEVINHHYCHEKSRISRVELDNYGHKNNKKTEKFTNYFEEYLTELMEDFSRAYYKALENDWDYINSDKSIEEGMEANEYTFTKDGKRFG
jgi:hypothetical protein